MDREEQKEKHATLDIYAFNDRFRALVKESKSPQAFADKTGLTRQNVEAICKKGRMPRVDTIMKICKNCGISADWLLGLVDETNYSPEQVVKEMATYTGLSTDAIYYLHSWKVNEYAGMFDLGNAELISRLICCEYEDGPFVLSSLYEYLFPHDKEFMIFDNDDINEKGLLNAEPVATYDINRIQIADSRGMGIPRKIMDMLVFKELCKALEELKGRIEAEVDGEEELKDE